MRTRAFVWAVIAVAVVLATRIVVYALVPQSLVVAELEHKTGNPHVLSAAFAGAGIAIAVAATVLWLATVAVRERLALEGRSAGEVPRPGLRRLAARAVGLTTVTSLTFAYVESYIHWREGLGWHGIDCLVGPVHRNAIPVLIAFSILAVALHAAVEHLLAWTRRLVTTLAARLPWAGHAPIVFSGVVRTPHARQSFSQGSPRGPPRLRVPVLSTQ
jgi:hypothetical protein